MDGFAAALQESLADPKQLESSPAQTEAAQRPAGVQEKSEDTASLILRLLLRASYNPGPNFAHLLLGFDVTDGVQGQQILPSLSKILCINVLSVQRINAYT